MSRDDLSTLLATCFPDVIGVDRTQPEALPTDKGAYLLAIQLKDPLPARLKTTHFTLAPGWYAYAGSANGPGGIRARLSRHFRAEKKPHWHIDQLTVAAQAMFALPFAGGSAKVTECDLIARLAATARFAVPKPGFGSSDCGVCTAHLLAFRGVNA